MNSQSPKEIKRAVGGRAYYVIPPISPADGNESQQGCLLFSHMEMDRMSMSSTCGGGSKTYRVWSDLGSEEEAVLSKILCSFRRPLISPKNPFA